MLRKLLSFLVVLAVIVALSGIFIHLYNNSNKKTYNFDTVKDEVKKKTNKIKKKKTNDDDKVENESSNKDTELDDNEVS